jgi:cob(I)alamin adenosyltransferase
MKIYTRTGDKGQTSLFGGKRVDKNHLRVAAYGTVDELNSCLGVAVAHSEHTDINQWLKGVQKDLFALGSWLASPEASEKLAAGNAGFEGERAGRTNLNQATVSSIESQIDLWEKELPPLRSFILPGGSEAGAQLHLARTICRRAEREVVGLQLFGEIVPDLALIYLNRLADALFVLARYTNYRDGKTETEWL